MATPSAPWELSIALYGDGEIFPAPWTFMLHRPGKDDFCDLLYASPWRGVWMFDIREAVGFEDKVLRHYNGRVKLAMLTDLDRPIVKAIISGVPIPRPDPNSPTKEYEEVYKCQYWARNVVAKLVAERKLEPGTTEFVQSLIGKKAVEWPAIAKEKWFGTLDFPKKR
ncbi:hypothetical protein VTN49DRAFT_8066 [Thermomyces lanuginosus]|uniref:uncharacterized protein n=1 Tax=Thermomyces lanuginosus TaxID=5541 RepID=UPI0037443AA8